MPFYRDSIPQGWVIWRMEPDTPSEQVRYFPARKKPGVVHVSGPADVEFIPTSSGREFVSYTRRAAAVRYAGDAARLPRAG